MDKELIDQIKDNLLTHEEVYTPGAWERFSVQQEKKKRGFIYWPLWSAAAAIIIIAGSLFFLRNNDDSQTKIVVNKASKAIKKPTTTTEESVDKPVIKENETSSSDQLDINKPFALENSINEKTASIAAIDENKNTTVNTSNTVVSLVDNSSSHNISNNQPTLLNTINSERIAQNPTSNNVVIALEKKKPIASKLTFEQILASDSYNNQLTKTEKSKKVDKWEPGVFVAPAMGNDNKVNMNYGFSLSYNVAKKLSISSGIAYTALSGKNDISNASSGMMNASPAASQAFSTNSKSLESVDARVRGINIPLELKYSISDKLYTGIGVSALAILNNKQENNYIVSQTQNSTVVNSMGYSEQKMLLVTERVSETQQESVIAPEKYLGFYNFSLGYKQKISPKKNIAVEPFLRVPMKNFSKDNLNLTNGGLRLKLDF
ncbi:hypothetical protein [Pedobacter jamesrossensis]|uniref:Outer membrane protein beta-barrel domain-containing protein n=1 Tax=Pedobacter jamesrossensis TaxID=1908238 RepID=A0ABV8NMZ3_9SPHI